MMIGPLSELQIQRNTQSREAWDNFAGHRVEVTRLILDSVVQPGGKLCVLGAGNCNDLEVAALLADFSEIELVDLDAQALLSGVARQSLDTSRLRLHGGVDVTGAADLLSAWSPQSPPADADVDRCLKAARDHKLPFLPARFSVVASTCLLSQLIEAIVLTLGESHPRFVEVLSCIRRRHLELMCELTAPGGTMILISDVVSSATCPAIEQAERQQLPAIVAQAIQARNFFTGVNPFLLKHILETDLALAPKLHRVQLSNPWLWNLGPRVYAVCAVTARKVDRR